MSAVVKQDWRPKTLRELFIQYQAVLIEDWSHTASLQIIHSDPKKKIKLSDLHPYMKASGSQGAIVPNTGVLGDILTG